jgi:hypothetical protein
MGLASFWAKIFRKIILSHWMASSSVSKMGALPNRNQSHFES